MAEVTQAEQWWESKKGQAHARVFEALRFYKRHQEYIEQANLLHMKLYENVDIMGFVGRDYARTNNHPSKENRVTFNVIRSMVDTVHSKVTKVKPKPLFLTKDGDWSLQRKAKKLNKFVEGLFHEICAYETGEKSFRDAEVFGSGIVKVYEDQNRVCIERIFPNEIIVDDEEALYSDPRSLHQRKLMTREVVDALYGSGSGNAQKSNAIARVERAEGDHKTRGFGRSDQIWVVESWHLPSCHGAKDGRHTITIEDCTLVDEPWTKDYFPFAVMHWSKKLLGFWGTGLCEELVEIQREINKLLRRIQSAMHRISVPRVYVEKGSKIVKQHMTNENATIVEFVGTPPIFDTPAAVHPEVFAHLDRLYQRAFEIAGVSQLSATSQKPSGLYSGVAMREYKDIETERFGHVQKNYERFMMCIAQLAIDVVRDVYDREGSFSVEWAGRSFLNSIDWGEVDLTEDQYQMQVFPTNFLPSTPAGRLQTVQEMMDMGLINREMGMSLLEYPDLESVTTLVNADVEDIKATIEDMLDGKYTPPEPFQNLELGMKMVLPALNKAKRNGAPEEVQELFRLWLEDAKALVTPPTPAPAQMAGPTAPGQVASPGGQPQPPELATPAAAPQQPQLV